MRRVLCILLISLWWCSNLVGQTGKHLSLTLWEKRDGRKYQSLGGLAEMTVLMAKKSEVISTSVEEILDGFYTDHYDLAKDGKSSNVYPITAIFKQVYVVFAQVRNGEQTDVYYSSNKNGREVQFKKVIQGEIRMWKVKDEALKKKIIEHFFDDLELAQKLEWRITSSENTLAAYQRFQKRHPNSGYDYDFNDKIAELSPEVKFPDDEMEMPVEIKDTYDEEEAVWEAIDQNDKEAVSSYLEEYPNSWHDDEAKQLLKGFPKEDWRVRQEALAEEKRIKEEEEQKLKEEIDLELLLYQEAYKFNDIEKYKVYLQQYPNGRYSKEALVLVHQHEESRLEYYVTLGFSLLVLAFASSWKLLTLVVLCLMKLHAWVNKKVQENVKLPSKDDATFVVKLLIMGCLWVMGSLLLALLMQVFVKGAVRFITPRMLALGSSIVLYYLVDVLEESKDFNDTRKTNGNLFILSFFVSSLLVSGFLFALGGLALKGWAGYAGHYAIDAALFSGASLVLFNVQRQLQEYNISQIRLYRFLKRGSYLELLKQLGQHPSQGIALIVNWALIGLMLALTADFMFLPDSHFIAKVYLSFVSPLIIFYGILFLPFIKTLLWIDAKKKGIRVVLEENINVN